MQTLIVSLCLLLIANQSFSDVIRPRGVSLSKKVFYDPSKDFTCTDGSQTILFTQVNDDYCDCADGSDEPGTPACSNGMFNCANVGYFEKELHSSKVNDGICDCCDGSDEYSSGAKCINSCIELGETAREEYRRMQEVIKTGSAVRELYKEQAKKHRTETSAQVEHLRQELQQLAEEKQQKLDVKQALEEEEKIALNQHGQLVEQQKKRFEDDEVVKVRDQERKIALEAFKELDLNEDGVLSFLEIMSFTKFDQNGDGQVTEIEAKFFLAQKDSMEVEEFVTLGWILAKPFYLKDKAETVPSDVSQTDFQEASAESHMDVEKEEKEEFVDEHLSHDVNGFDQHENLPEHKEDEYGEELEEEEDSKDDYGYKPSDSNKQNAEIDYSEETKEIIEKAKNAKNEYTDVESRHYQVENKIRELENSLNHDYGAEDEYMAIHGQCFEYSDREYTYKLCPFDRAAQISKNGGSEVNLGRWGRWTGPEHDRYSSFKMEGGMTCWNGPPRSVDVVLTCGPDNLVTSATEPSRCEYMFEFQTPARCVMKANESEYHHEHTEL